MCARCTASRLSDASACARLPAAERQRRRRAAGCRRSRRSSRARPRSRARARCRATRSCCSASITRLRHLRDLPPEVALVAVDEEPHQPRDVFDALPQRRQVNRIDAQAVVQVGAEACPRRPPPRGRDASRRSRARPPSSCARIRRARTRLPAARGGTSPGSPAAGRRSRRGRSCRRRPARSGPAASPTAPVNAPFSWPNSSLSTSVGGSAAQLTRTSGRACRRLRSCSARANSSLPVPVGPEQQHARVGRRDLRQARQREPQRRALADDVVEVVIALDLLFQIHVVRLEPGVQPFDLGDAGAQRVLVAAAAAARRPGSLTTSCRRSTSGCGHRRVTPGAVDHQRADHLPGDRRRHAQDGAGPHAAVCSRAAIASAGSSSGREMATSSPRARRSMSQASGTGVWCAVGRRSRCRWERAHAPPRPTR